MVKKSYLTPSMDGEKKIRTSILCGSNTGGVTFGNGETNSQISGNGGSTGQPGQSVGHEARQRSVSSLD